MTEAVLEGKLELLDRFVGKTLADKYRIESEWRDSGLGKVYHATHLLMDKPVAIKILSPALAVDIKIANRFSAEARTVSSLSHANILNVTDFGTTANGTVYIVFEDAKGETVNESLAFGSKFPVERAVGVAKQIASALAVSHEKGIIHKHLSSKSVLIAKISNGRESVKVLDYGAVKPQDDGMFAEEFSVDELKYIAPELISSIDVEDDERSDVYSLGVILYEMLAGEVPFSAESGDDLLKKQSENPPPPLSSFRDDIPDGLEPVILRALSKNPDMRYQLASALAEDLAGFLSVSNETDLIPTAKASDVVEGNNNIWKTAFVVLAGISLLSAALIYTTSSRQTDPATQLQTDANGQPVQPLNPATGINEQNLGYTNDGTMPEFVGNSSFPAGAVMPGGDGYDPWARGGLPPAGAPNYPPGQMITIPGDGTGSQFMPGLDASGGIILIPINVDPNTAASPTPTPKTGKTPLPANSQELPAANQTPKDGGSEVKPADGKDKTPATKPSATPKGTTKPTETTDKSVKSGVSQDSN